MRFFVAVLSILLVGDFSMGSLSTYHPQLKGSGKIIDIVGGLSSFCVLKDNGTVQCWQNKTYPDFKDSFPDDLDDTIEISGGYEHICALRRTGQVICLTARQNNAGQSEVPTDIGPLKQLAAGHAHTCAVDLNNLVHCWPEHPKYNDLGQTQVPQNLGPVLSISAGPFNTCAVLVSGLVKCWGRLFGDEYYRDINAKIPSSLRNPKSLVSNGDQVCAIDGLDKVICWGNENYPDVPTPSGLGKVKKLLARYSRSCAIQKNDLPICWEKKDQPYSAIQIPAEIKKVKLLALDGIAQSCAVDFSNKLTCWNTMSGKNYE